jgi:hypothetical protein
VCVCLSVKLPDYTRLVQKAPNVRTSEVAAAFLVSTLSNETIIAKQENGIELLLQDQS